jgi:hypothetical protein
METTMKMIMAALTATAFLAGAAAPASAETDMVEIGELLAKRVDSEMVKLVKERRNVTRQIEYDTSKLPVGSSEWWRQVERDQGGRRR